MKGKIAASGYISLDELAAAPARVIELSADARQRITLQCAALVAAIAGSTVEAPVFHRDELLNAQEAAPGQDERLHPTALE
jgi:hypothetical protein